MVVVPGPGQPAQAPILTRLWARAGLSGPDPGAVETVESGAHLVVATFEAANPAFTSGVLLDRSAEGERVSTACRAFGGLALARDDDGPDAEAVQLRIEAGLAVAAVAGGSTRRSCGWRQAIWRGD